jgi:hypothetical protein
MFLSTLKNLNVSIVDGDFDCYVNTLTSLEGCPNEVKGYFDCHHNILTTLEGCPSKVGHDFYCHNNSKKFTKDEVKSLCRVKGKIRV